MKMKNCKIHTYIIGDMKQKKSNSLKFGFDGKD